MEFREIENKEEWEKLMEQFDYKTFLQSYAWGDFQKSLGHEVKRLALFNENKLVGLSLVLIIKAKRGRFIFLPHGPICKKENRKEVLKNFFENLKDLAKKEKCSFMRIATTWERGENKMFSDLGFREAPLHVNPEITWELDISKSEEEILSGMRKTTRYLIRQGMKNKDLIIRKTTDERDVEIFNEIYKKTVVRHHFVPFSLNYLKKELEYFKDNIMIFTVEYMGDPIASAMVIYWQGTAFYHQGASNQKYPKIPGSYYLQWEAIREAKRRNCKLYNFWGIADLPETELLKAKFHPWWGLSLFKMGFGGERKEYIKTQDYVLSPLYYISYIIDKYRKRKRRL